MFLNRRQLKQLTGISCSDPEAQKRELERRGIRHLGINAGGLLIVPCAAIEGGKESPPSWSPDFSGLRA
jgi:hypothetical protein